MESLIFCLVRTASKNSGIFRVYFLLSCLAQKLTDTAFELLSLSLSFPAQQSG